MKIFFKHIITPRLGILALLLLLCSSRMYAQTTDGTYIDSVFTVAKGDTLRWFGNVEIAATSKIYLEDGAKVYFYGDTLKINPGAQILGTSAAWTTFTAGLGTGSVVFQKPNPQDNSTNQQVLSGGYKGSTIANTFVGLEIDNLAGLKLWGSNAHIGSNLTFTNGHIYVDNRNLVLGSAATITGADATKFVVTDNGGFLAKEGLTSATVNFPVGSSDVSTNYLPATLKNSGTTDSFSVRAIGTLTPAPATGVSDLLTRSWQITEGTPGGSNVTLGLQHNSASNQGATYIDATAQILASPAAAAWKAASTNATGQAAGTVAGSSLHTVIGVTDFTTNTYFTKGLFVATTPDLYAWFTNSGSTFQMTGSSVVDNRNAVVNVGELSGIATSGTIEIRITKNANFDLTFNPTATTINVGIPRTVNNADWTMTSTPAYYSFKTTKVIVANGTLKFGVNFKVKSGITSSAETSISGTIITGSGGEVSGDNANNSVMLPVSIQF